MKTNVLHLPRFLFLLAALLLTAAGDAHAKRAPKLYTFGDDFYDLGEVKLTDADSTGSTAMSGVKVGYHCQAFGLFWVNIFTWSGEFCLYQGSGLETKKYQPISQEDAAKFLGVAKISKPWNYSFPPGMMIVIGLVGLKFVPRLLAKKKAAAASQKWQGGGSAAPEQPSWSAGMYTPPNPPPPMPGAGTPPPMPPPMPPDQR